MAPPARTAPKATVSLGGPFLACAGLAMGIALPAAGSAAVRTFGSDSTSTVTLALVGALAVAAGAAIDRLPREKHEAHARLLGWRLALLGALLLLAALATPAGVVLGWAGASADSGTVGVVLARVVFAGLWLLPAGWAAGSALRGIAALLPEGIAAARAGSVGTLFAVLGGFVAVGAELAVVAAWRFAAPAAGLILLAMGAVLLRGGSEPRADADDAVGIPRLEMSWLLVAAAVGFGASALRFHADRLLGPIAGDELADLPVADVVFAAGCFAGAALGLVLTLRARCASVPAAAMLAACAGIVALARSRSWDALPLQFIASLPGSPSLDALLSQTLNLLAVRWAPGAVLVGGAILVLAASLPAERAARGAWVRSLATGAAFGLALGSAAARWSVAPLGLDGMLAGIAIRSPRSRSLPSCSIHAAVSRASDSRRSPRRSSPGPCAPCRTRTRSRSSSSGTCARPNPRSPACSSTGSCSTSTTISSAPRS